MTLRSEPIAITVQGGAAATQNVTASQSASPSPAIAVAPQRTQKPQDILYQLTDRPATTESFAPLYTRTVFWTAQLIPLLALIGFAGWKIRQTRIDNREARRIDPRSRRVARHDGGVLVLLNGGEGAEDDEGARRPKVRG